jgi:hypothetical protein
LEVYHIRKLFYCLSAAATLAVFVWIMFPENKEDLSFSSLVLMTHRGWRAFWNKEENGKLDLGFESRRRRLLALALYSFPGHIKQLDESKISHPLSSLSWVLPGIDQSFIPLKHKCFWWIVGYVLLCDVKMVGEWRYAEHIDAKLVVEHPF